MRLIEEDLRLQFKAKLSHEKIAAATALSKGVALTITQVYASQHVASRARAIRQ